MIQLDYASTTPIRKEVLDTYTMLLSKYYGNSDSLHDIGRENARLMEQSRANIAQLFHVQKDEIFFTSCASESNNYATKAYAWANQRKGKHLITTCVEHSSITNAMKQLEESFGFEVTYLPVNEKGVVSLEDLEDFPYLSYDQGIHNSFYYSEEILSQIPHKKSIVVSDRATLFNLLIGLDGYTIATGILNSNLNGDNIVSIPLDIDDEIDIVYLKHEKATLSKMGEKFLDNLVKEVTFDN